MSLSQLSLPVLLHVPHLYPLLHFLFRKREASHGYQPALAHQDAVKLGVSSPIEAGGGSPVGAKFHKRNQQSHRQPLLPLLGVSHEDQAAQLLHLCTWLTSVLPRLPGCWFSLCEHLWAQVGWFSRFSCGVLSPCASFNLLCPLCLTLVADWSLSNNSYAPVCKCSKISLAVSGVDSLLIEFSQEVGTILRWTHLWLETEISRVLRKMPLTGGGD